MKKTNLIIGLTVLACVASMVGCTPRTKEEISSNKNDKVSAAEQVPDEKIVTIDADTIKNEDRKTLDLEFDQYYKVDFNGDGNDELLRAIYDKKNVYEMSLELNGDTVNKYQEVFEDTFEIRLVDMNTEDNEIELCVYNEGISIDPKTYFYRYDGNKLNKINDGKEECFANLYSEDYVVLSFRTDLYYGTGYNASQVFKYSNGTLESALQDARLGFRDEYDTEVGLNISKEANVIDELTKACSSNSFTFFAEKDLDLYDFDAKKASFTKNGSLEKYAEFTITKIYFSDKTDPDWGVMLDRLYICAKDGKEGWIDVSDVKMEEKRAHDESWYASGADKIYGTLPVYEPAPEGYSGVYEKCIKDGVDAFTNGILFPIMLAD